MVHVVFAKVVFREIGDVGLLNVWDVARANHTDIHLGSLSESVKRTKIGLSGVLQEDIDHVFCVYIWWQPAARSSF